MSPFGHPSWDEIPLRMFGDEVEVVPMHEIEERDPPVRLGCGHEYDPGDPKAAKHHTGELDGGQCCRRCKGKPACYPCGGMWCTCWEH